MPKDDLVARLRERAARKWTDQADRSASLFGQAADTIEALRAEVAAIRTLALEEAAKVAEGYFPDGKVAFHDYAAGEQFASETIAERMRALKQETKTHEG